MKDRQIERLEFELKNQNRDSKNEQKVDQAWRSDFEGIEIDDNTFAPTSRSKEGQARVNEHKLFFTEAFAEGQGGEIESILTSIAQKNH